MSTIYSLSWLASQEHFTVDHPIFSKYTLSSWFQGVTIQFFYNFPGFTVSHLSGFTYFLLIFVKVMSQMIFNK
jgi:hypothetical protein